jgi:hypothetical protein
MSCGTVGYDQLLISDYDVMTMISCDSLYIIDLYGQCNHYQ